MGCIKPESLAVIASDLLECLAREGSPATGRRLGAADVAVDAAGRVRIRGGARRAAADADLHGARAVGRMLSRAAAGPAANGSSWLEAPADVRLGLALESLAMGAFGQDPAGAAELFRDAIGGLSSDRAISSREELGAVVRSVRWQAADTRPAARPPSLGPPARPPARPPAPARSRAPLVSIAALAVVIGSVLLGAGVATHGRPASRPGTSAERTEPVADAVIRSEPRSTPSPAAPTPPALGPLAAGPIQRVEMTTAAPCRAGAACAASVLIGFTGSRASTAFAWSFVFHDRCTGADAAVGRNAMTAPAGWNTVIGSTTAPLPPGHGGWLVAVTSAPAAAASQPVEVDGPACG